MTKKARTRNKLSLVFWACFCAGEILENLIVSAMFAIMYAYGNIQVLE